MSIWSLLGIDPTKDAAEIKRAYAARSREVHPEDSPEEFRLLHEAYLAALAYARRTVPEEQNTVPVPAPAAEDHAGYREIVLTAEQEEFDIINAAVRSALERLAEFIAANGSVNDYTAAMGAPLTLGNTETRICFFSAFVRALTEFISSREKFPDKFYEAVTVVYEFSPKLAPSPARDLQPLYSVLRTRKRLTTRKERLLERLSDILIPVPTFIIIGLALSGSIGDAFPLVVVCLMLTLASAGIIIPMQRKNRAPGPYHEELQSFRKRRVLR